MRAALVIVSVMLGFGVGLAALRATSQISDQKFEQNIAQYISLRRQIQQRTAGPRASADRADIGRAADELADAIRAARPFETAGHIFTPAVARQFRRQPCEAPVREDSADARTPAVNDRFDWRGADAMSPALIAALPPLPGELQYRIVNCDLVLVDIAAGLVIDVVPRASLDHRQP
jgi:hypothetical protein